MEIVNTNYICKSNEVLQQILSNLVPCKNKRTPHMYKIKNTNGTLLVFKSGKIRYMGRGIPPFGIEIVRLMSMTTTSSLNQKLNLYQLSRKYSSISIYEPELFPALRFINFNPRCVNVFSSGKIIMMGLKTINEGEHIYKSIQSWILD